MYGCPVRMQSLRSRVPITTSHKRARCLSFPGGFEERILRRMKARSEFVRAQLECLGDDGTSGRLQLPEEIGSLWVDCILSTPSELRATDDKTLAACLKVRSYAVLCAPSPLIRGLSLTGMHRIRCELLVSHTCVFAAGPLQGCSVGNSRFSFSC